MKLLYYPLMENHMEKNMENEMETVVMQGFRELNLSYSIGETLSFTIYTHYGNPTPLILKNLNPIYRT